MINGFFPALKNSSSTEVDRLLRDMFGPLNHRPTVSTSDAVPLNIFEQDGNYRIEAALPGVSIADLEILAENKTLSIKGKWPVDSESTIKWHRQERARGDFARLIGLPEDADSNKIEAVMKNGILTLSIPQKEKVLPRKIEIKRVS